jgi:hypothetical protein
MSNWSVLSRKNSLTCAKKAVQELGNRAEKGAATQQSIGEKPNPRLAD